MATHHDTATSAPNDEQTRGDFSSSQQKETEPYHDASNPHVQTTDPEKSSANELNGDTRALNSDDESAPKGGDDAEKKPVNPWMDPSQFPDGGAKAWLTVAGAAACLFVSFGWINAIGVFQAYYQTHQLKEYSPSEIAWIPSLQVFFMLFGGAFIGKIFDDYGPRYLLLAGTFFHVFGLMMTSISTKYYQFLLSQAICSAIGASCVFYPAFTCVTTWFFKKRGAALGLVTAGSSLGGVIFPIMVIKLIPEVGFGWTMRICAFLILACLIFANLTVRSRIRPSRRPFKVMAFFRPLGELRFFLLTVAVCFFYWGMFVPFTFIVVEAQSKGMSSSLANYLVPILNAASIFGRTIPNVIADKKGRFNVMLVMSLSTAIVILALWIPANANAPLIVFAALFGIASGAGIGLTPALAASLSPIEDIGVRTGAILAMASFAALTGSPIAGAIVKDSHSTFRNAQIFSGVSCLVAFCFFAATRVTIAGFKITKV